MTEPAHIIDIRVDGGGWSDAGAKLTEVVHAAAAASLGRSLSGGQQAELSVFLTDSQTVSKLNEAWRGKPVPTNVLSFPGDGMRCRNGAAALLGDVVLAYEVIEQEAVEADLPLPHHLSHLVVHGVLHLLGYDHMTESDALAMEQVEAAILASLGIPDPYRGAEADLESSPQ